MTEFVDRVSSAPCSQNYRPQCDAEVAHVVPRLERALGPAWSIDTEVDPHGEYSLVVLPADLDRPVAIILYDEGAHVAMAVVVDEQWTDFQRFASVQHLESAIVAQARRLAPS